MKMKKAFAAILAGTMCAGMLVGCGTSQATQSDSETDRAVKVSDYDGEITLVIATKDEFLGTLDNAVKAAAEINNVELHSVDCGADQDKQNDAVRAAAAQRGGVSVKAWGLTDIGNVREVNQDTFRMICREDADIGVFLVCDGMGGAKAGEVASSMAADAFLKEIGSAWQTGCTRAMLEDTYSKVNDTLFDAARNNPDYSGMGPFRINSF